MCKLPNPDYPDCQCYIAYGRCNKLLPRMITGKEFHTTDNKYEIYHRFNYCPRCGYEIPDSW